MKLVILTIVIAAAAPAWADGSAFQPKGAVGKCTTAADVTIAIEVVPHGAWLGTSSGVRCFVPRKAGALDGDALEDEAKAIVLGLPERCKSSVEIAAVPGVPYQDLITAMDFAIKAGLVDVGMTSPDKLDVRFDDSAARERRAPAHCTGQTVTSSKPPPPPPTSSKPISPPPASGPVVDLGSIELPPPAPKPDLSQAPVIVVTATELSFQGKGVATVTELARGKGEIRALVTVLRAQPTPADPKDKVVIIQADRAIDAGVINRVVVSTRAAGFDNVLFAVKNK